MDTARLRDGFRVGEWLIEPRAARATAPAGRSVELTPAQTQLLVALAERHGEAIPKRELRTALWPGAAGTEERLRETVASLRLLFGESSRDPRYIASVGPHAYALVAHVDAVPAPRGDADPPPRPARLHGLLSELRRRNVVKVAVSYLVAMWIVLQVAEVTFAPLRFPGWWMTALTIIAIIGVPIVLVLAWTYEITPQGVVLDQGGGGAGLATLPRPRARQALAPALVGGVALMAVVTGFAWWRSIDARNPPAAPAETAAAPGPPSIAVLPLMDLSPAGGNAWLGDGLSEELASRLAQVSGLRVAARTSSFMYRGSDVDVRRIGQSLGVGHLLEGSVRREGDTVRVRIQLVDTRSGYQVWAGNFDRAWRDVLALQDDIAGSVTGALEVVLRKDTSASPAAGDTLRVEAAAIDPYLEGLALLRQSGDRSALEDAIRRFEAALAADPVFGRAYAGLCTACVARYRHTRDPGDLASAERACRKALEVAPGLTESEQALAGLYVTSGRYDVAIAMYRALIAKDPHDADDVTGLAQALEGLGRLDEAEAHFRRAAEVEPAYWGAHKALGGFLFGQGRMAEAAAAYRRAAELVPSSASAWNNLGAALFMQGDAAGAVPIYEKSLALEPSRSAYSNLATAYYLAGRFREAVDTYGRAAATAPNDQTLWGNLADAQWQWPESRAQARGSYARAIELAERDLGLGAGEPMLLAQLGYYHGRVGNCPRGREYLAEALSRGSNQMYVQYFATLAAADCDDPATLQRAATEALRLGYPKALLDIDPALKGKLAASRS